MSTISFRAQDGPLGALLAERARPDGLSPSLVAKRDLGRYYAILANSAAELKEAIRGEDEAHLVLDALNGLWLLDDFSLGMAWAEVAEHISLNDAADKWGLNEESASSLVERLRRLSPGARAALLDATEAWWHDDSDSSPIEKLRRAGLVGGPDAP